MKFFKCRICGNPIEADEDYCIDCRSERPVKDCIVCRKPKSMLAHETTCEECKKEAHWKGPGAKNVHKPWV